jgi:GT2 family glycosyltransferase
MGHVIDDSVDRLFPTFYAGGGSSAYDRRKFLELGGFDPLLHPFYVEDADVSYMAWKRGWKVLYAPGSIVFHEHRGTIGKRFTRRTSTASSLRTRCWWSGRASTIRISWRVIF